MAVSLIITDGGVNGLLAVAAMAERSKPESLPLYWYPGAIPLRLEVERAACRAQGHLYGVSEAPERNASVNPASNGGFETTCRVLLEAALLVRRLGGGEVIWPVNAPTTASGGPDIEVVSRAVNQALLISQLASLTAPKGTEFIEDIRVHIRVPYADLIDRQLADLILDMDLPIWTCWFWSVGQGEEDQVREAAAAERTRWTTLLRDAGWTGSFDPSDAPRIVTLPRDDTKPAPRTSGEPR